MRSNKDEIQEALIICFLILQTIATTVQADRPEFLTTELRIRNGMHGTKRPEVVYHCRSSGRLGLDYGWRRTARPPMEHSLRILVEGEEEIHLCHFQSVLGIADVYVRTTAVEASTCEDVASCGVHVATRDGIVFEGFEWDFGHRYPMLKPLRYVEAVWKPWPRRGSKGRA